MCYKVECQTCKKYTWGGCGKHLPSLYNSIEKGKHCQCRSWPGVVIPTQGSGKVASLGCLLGVVILRLMVGLSIK
ncbi:hypothetical protein TorRG33x02_016270 [Trema orientale]|uniref:Uncharacterized protein n=1 Tax=Trema orientale TaxID=63057 RepID=A0A2P5FXW5_TREOI|nr:hypothetical protein TorRG33x02_016270 [Trema orientale]